MRKFLLPFLAALLLAPATSTVTATPAYCAPGVACCKVCKKGKACGDSCIAKNKTCTKGKGCACNG